MVNINKDPLHKLEDIIHIGPVRAEQIIDMRADGVKFRDVFELSTILGLGPKRMADIIKQGYVEV